MTSQKYPLRKQITPLKHLNTKLKLPSPKNLLKLAAPKALSLPDMVIGKKLVAAPISDSYL
jgi:hypothetical protein